MEWRGVPEKAVREALLGRIDCSVQFVQMLQKQRAKLGNELVALQVTYADCRAACAEKRHLS